MSNPTGKIEFLENHLPALQSGEYEIIVTQNFAGTGIDWPAGGKTSAQKFRVLGDPYQLKPKDIQAVFPPDGSLGDHTNVLPHILLNRSTHPWEYNANPADEETPWLALLVFHEEDMLGGMVEKEVLLKAFPENGEALWTELLTKHWVHAEGADKATIGLGETIDANALGDEFRHSATQIKAFLNNFRAAFTIPLQELGLSPVDNSLASVIDVPPVLLQTLLPTEADLKSLVHVRRRLDENDKLVGEEWAVVLANRLPHQGEGLTRVHLVSIHNKYRAGHWPETVTANANGFVRLVSLKSWRFACRDPKQSFKGLFLHLNRLFSTAGEQPMISQLDSGALPDHLKNQFAARHIGLGTPLEVEVKTGWEARGAEDEGKWLVKYADVVQYEIIADKTVVNAGETPPQFYVYQRGPNTQLRLPFTGDAKLDPFIVDKGCVPLYHQMRSGNKVLSWYHGPLAVGPQTATMELPAETADQLYIYHPNNRFFDVSYAAAWELGRLQALKSQDLSMSLYLWKRTHKRQLLSMEQALLHPHIAPQAEKAHAALPEKIRNWFDNLRLLKGIPFNYLVPDEQMLPKESIRFFTVDHLWIDCLIDGAFSIGRVISGDHKHDKRMFRHVVGETPHNISGFLLRSDLVSGWRILLLDAYAAPIPDDVKNPTDTPLPILRREKLSENVLLCLFDGEFQTLDFHQKPEALHFGLDFEDGRFRKEAYYVNAAGDTQDAIIPSDEIPWKNETEEVLNIDSLSTNIKGKLGVPDFPNPDSTTPMTSAQFAMAMIEGVEKVRFKKHR